MRTVLVLVPLVVIVYFMPRDDDFGYSYHVDKPWYYGDLIAKTKFPVLKKDSLIKRERERVMLGFQPYYNIDPVVLDTVLNRLHKGVEHEWQGSMARTYVKHIEALLDTIYARGILSTDDYARLSEVEQHDKIRVVAGNVATSVPITRLFTPRSAYSYIMHTDTARYSRYVLQQFNLNEILLPNLTYDANLSKVELDTEMQGVSSYSGFVQAGQKIVGRGELVTEDVYNVLRSYEQDIEKLGADESKVPYRLIGQTIFVLVVLLALLSYLVIFRDDYFDNARNVTLLFVLLTIFCVVASLMVSHKILNVFMLPYCLVPIVIRIFMDSRTAFMFHCGMVLIISLILTSSYEFLFLQTVAGLFAVQNLRELSQRSQIVRTAFFIFVIYVVLYTGYSLYHENALNADRWMYICFVVNGILLLFTYPLLWLFERVFGFVSDVTLVELSNVHTPLLKRMTEVAPGTFQHSMQVANLSAEVAAKIGANAQLVRTGALYHDIGKMERPAFFTENQSGHSPHKYLTPLKSAQVIIAHVTKGVELADKHNLPQAIRRFILTHHGHGKAKYFYVTYRNQHPDEPVDEAPFTYPGPNPSSKEEAILMMCDSTEAASRSLPEYTEESITQLVDRIIDGQVAEGYFSESDITFRDIAMAKAVLKEKLKTIYHTRITYPELEENK